MTQLTDEEKSIYEWQIWLEDFGEQGQCKLRQTRALVSRVGGLGGPVAQQLVAAGFGKVLLAHAGNLKPSDLNRQILMRYDGLGHPRAAMAKKRLCEYNPKVEVEAVSENIHETNAAQLVSKVDIVFDCAPLFEERMLMNRECFRQGKPMIDSAVYGMQGQVTTIIPGQTPCLACLCPENTSSWKRQFPVLGAVSAMAASIAVAEAIKLLAGLGPSLIGKVLYFDLRNMHFQVVTIARRPDCTVCGGKT
jgi:molybdopterin/thiamine biosynthesis adenylyltransferase